MPGLVIDLLQIPILHNLTRIHNSYFVADFRNNAQIVGNQNHGSLELPLKVADHRQYLGLNGYIQGRCGLVRQKQLGAAGQGDGDHHPLLHPTGKLVRKFIGTAGVNAHHSQHIHSPRHRLRSGALVVQVDHLGNLPANGERRV